MSATLFSQKEQEILKLEVRRKIYDLVKRFSGCNFHHLERKSEMSIGTLQYHLNYLTKHRLITAEKDGNKIRYFTQNISLSDKRMLACLRQRNIRHIVLFILRQRKCRQKDIAQFMKLSPSTVSWYLARMVRGKLLDVAKNKGELLFSLAGKEAEIIALLVAYKESFFDQLVDQTIDMWAFRI